MANKPLKDMSIERVRVEEFGDSLATGISREITVRLDFRFLSYSAPVVMTLQLPTCFTRVTSWRVTNCESLARFSRENPLNAHTLEFFTLFSHTTFT